MKPLHGCEVWWACCFQLHILVPYAPLVADEQSYRRLWGHRREYPMLTLLLEKKKENPIMYLAYSGGNGPQRS